MADDLIATADSSAATPVEPTREKDGHAAHTARPRVLIVGPADTAASGGLVKALQHCCELVYAESVEAAMHVLAEQRFGGVISDAGDFGELIPDSRPTSSDTTPSTAGDGDSPCEAEDAASLPRTLLAQQAGQILDTVGEGVVIVDGEGRCRWMNRRMQQWPPAVHEQVRRACAEAFRYFSVHPASESEGAGDENLRRALASKRYLLTASEEHYLEAIASAVRDERGRCRQIIAVIIDATSTRRLQQKIDAIDKAGAELVKIESEAVATMTMSERLKLLEEKVIRVTRDLMHFDHFNVRLVDPRANRLELVVASGLPPEALEIELMAEADANGISGYVAKTGRSYICPDVTRDPRYIGGLDGARSSLTVPLTLDDQIIGVFNIESRRTAAFNEDDRQFAEIFGRYVAIALSILKLLVTERAATNKKVTDDVASEIAGPLNDIAIDAAHLLDELGQDESLRRRLQAMLDNVECIRGSMRQAARGPQTVLGTRDLAQQDPPLDPTLEGRHVLVVDDESTIREVVADVLRKYRVVVTVETTAQGAIDRLLDANVTYDLVLSDIRMPDKSGYDIFAAARRLPTPPPVVLMTGFGYDPNHCIVRASQEGLQAVLFKPFRVEQLLVEVRKAIGARQ